MIQAAEERRLQDIVDTEGIETFCKLEEGYVLGLECRRSVVATGGSVVYSKPAMQHLRENGIVVGLELPLWELKARLTNLGSRGVVIKPGKDLADLFAERRPLYENYADVTVDCLGKTHEQVVLAVIDAVAGWKGKTG